MKVFPILPSKTEVIQMPSNDDVSTADVGLFFDVLTQRTSDVDAFKKIVVEIKA